MITLSSQISMITSAVPKQNTTNTTLAPFMTQRQEPCHPRLKTGRGYEYATQLRTLPKYTTCEINVMSRSIRSVLEKIFLYVLNVKTLIKQIINSQVYTDLLGKFKMAQKLWLKKPKSSQLVPLEGVGVMMLYQVKRKSLTMHSGVKAFLKRKRKTTIIKPSLMFQICTTRISSIMNPMPMIQLKMKKKQPLQRKGAAKRSQPCAKANGKRLLYLRRTCFKRPQLPRYSTKPPCNNIYSSRMRKEGSFDRKWHG